MKSDFLVNSLLIYKYKIGKPQARSSLSPFSRCVFIFRSRAIKWVLPILCLTFLFISVEISNLKKKTSHCEINLLRSSFKIVCSHVKNILTSNLWISKRLTATKAKRWRSMNINIIILAKIQCINLLFWFYISILEFRSLFFEGK